MEKETWLDDKGNKITEEYIIINKTTLEKRIERLEKQRDEYSFNPNRTEDYYRYNSMIKILKEILSQSTSLIPEIEKAFTKGERYGWDTHKSISNIDEMKEKIKIQSLENYITNLKLDI